jgi:mono/diheme cytochrome c family protein
MTVRSALLAPVLLLLVACQEQTDTSPPDSLNPQTGRWYSEEQLQAGEQLFLENCAVCHGQQAQGLAANWRQRLDDGSLPPPPLNGTAHAWHHPLSVLLQVIDEGGVALGGTMPGFADTLDEEEKRAVIAWFQSFWSEEIYGQWLQMGGTN